jgi:hypothetical protein
MEKCWSWPAWLRSARITAPSPVISQAVISGSATKGYGMKITREEIIGPEERYRVQERLRALNALGFSVGEVRIETSENTEKLRLRFMVTDRNFHRDQLLGLTGMAAEEMQARQMMNEIQELKANFVYTAQPQHSPWSSCVPLVGAHIYEPTIQSLATIAGAKEKPRIGVSVSAELYCQVLEHKWYLSEQAQQRRWSPSGC